MKRLIVTLLAALLLAACSPSADNADGNVQTAWRDSIDADAIYTVEKGSSRHRRNVVEFTTPSGQKCISTGNGLSCDWSGN